MQSSTYACFFSPSFLFDSIPADAYQLYLHLFVIYRLHCVDFIAKSYDRFKFEMALNQNRYTNKILFNPNPPSAPNWGYCMHFNTYVHRFRFSQIIFFDEFVCEFMACTFGILTGSFWNARVPRWRCWASVCSFGIFWLNLVEGGAQRDNHWRKSFFFFFDIEASYRSRVVRVSSVCFKTVCRANKCFTLGCLVCLRVCIDFVYVVFFVALCIIVVLAPLCHPCVRVRVCIYVVFCFCACVLIDLNE